MKRAIYLNTCCAFAACLIGVAWAQQSVPGTIVEKKGVIVPSSKAPQQSTQKAPQQAAPVPESAAGISLDVVGIKPGMTVRDAMLALKADNPRMTLAPSTREFEGFTGPLLFSVFGEEAATPGPNSLPLRAGENVEILFTLPPNQEVVWAVRRVYNFAGAERPSLQNLLEALHRKYGPETVPADPDPRNNTKGIVWVYDGQGRPLGPSGQQIYRTCGTFGNYFGNGGLAAVNDIQSAGRPVPPECKAYIVVNASVQAGIDPASSQYVVSNMGAVLADGGRYRTAIDATRGVIVNAAKAREKKQTDEVNKRGTPKL